MSENPIQAIMDLAKPEIEKQESKLAKAVFIQSLALIMYAQYEIEPETVKVAEGFAAMEILRIIDRIRRKRRA